MSLLMLSFVYISYPGYDAIVSQLESTQINNDTLKTDDLSVVFKEGVYTRIINVYEQNQNVETALCFQGDVNEKKYFVEDFYKPKILSQGPRHVHHEQCSQEIVMFHTHPKNRCTASSQDIETLNYAKTRNEDIIMIIMCNKNRFSIYN
jgi:proteasome lid subunit RPN8/RPN11